MGTVVVSVQLSSYKATVHYESCKLFSPVYHHSKLPIPPSIKWKLCHWCKPVAEDIVTIASEITWAHNPADVMNLRGGMVMSFSDDLEKRAVRQDLNGGEPTVDRLR